MLDGRQGTYRIIRTPILLVATTVCSVSLIHFQPMSLKVEGNTRGLAPSELRIVERLYRRNIGKDAIVTTAFGRELSEVAKELGRRVGAIVSREGEIEIVFLGTREILYLPDLGRYRLGAGRLRRMRLIFSDLSRDDSGAHLPSDILTDLEKLRLDSVVAVKVIGDHLAVRFGYLVPVTRPEQNPIVQESLYPFQESAVPFQKLIQVVEDQLIRGEELSPHPSGGAVIVGVYPKNDSHWRESVEELEELARTAGVKVLDKVIQRRPPDPRTVVGKGKLEELVLLCLRVGAELLIFDGELKPFQWRVITNSTELKVIDRSMLILDIFAQRARGSDGRLQVELAQLKY
ncbi:MAG: hypothetical protein KDD60_11580, partial [Bdellovibrionales bacterium]|nr:hypothetical protein [Bdellovibrionales bacterium]